MAHHGNVTKLLAAWRDGNKAALDELTPLVHEELWRVAKKCLRNERKNHTLQATALVNEAYLKLAEDNEIEFRDRGHFFALAAQVVRNILVDYARARKAEKRGGGETPLRIEDFDSPVKEDLDVLALHDALDGLHRTDPGAARVAELRFFGGLTTEEIAAEIQMSPATVKREWTFARAYLYREARRGEARAAVRPSRES